MTNAFDRWKASREAKAFAARDRAVRAFDRSPSFDALAYAESASALLDASKATTSSAGAAAPLGRFAPVGLGRWRVERAGSLSGGYGPGWVAYTGVNLNTHGDWFPTWRAAMDYAVSKAV